jgi:prepilin peptidase CpaA
MNPALPLIVLCVAAAAWDFWTLRVPNLLNAAVALSFVAAALAFPGTVDWTSHLTAGALVLTVGAAMFALNLLGGGDVKLAAAVALWMGLDIHLLHFLLWMALVGGMLVLVLVPLRLAVSYALPEGNVRFLPATLRRRGCLPYAVAIAAGAVAVAARASLLP